jgi:cell pole-organizing protein PopZ
MGDMNQDPSMEEILASIKRVISDDARPAGPVSRTRGKPGSSESEPAGPAALAPLPPPPDPEEDVLELSDPLPPEDGLISQNVTAATRSSLATLAAMRQQSPKHFEPQQPGEGPLEAVVREMLRPMLKEWLDTRLPEMVEDMVSREIARITGKSF